MEMVSLTSEEKSKFALAGVATKVEIVDGSVKVLHVTDQAGRTFRIQATDYGSALNISQPKPVTVHTVSLGTKIIGSFETEKLAEEFAETFGAQHGIEYSRFTIAKNEVAVSSDNLPF